MVEHTAGTKQSRRLVIYLYLVILLSLISIIITLVVNKTAYWYDEIIVTNISTQTIKSAIETNSAEPHPMGFILLLKPLPVENPVITRMIVISISYLIILLAIYVAQRSNIFENEKILIGLLFFITSPFWFMVTFSIKQDAISVPLLILLIFISLAYWKTNRFSLLVVGYALALMIFFFGYMNGIRALGIVSIISILKFNKKNLIPFVITVFLLLIYFLLIGYNQFLNNTGRFTWFGDTNKDFYTVMFVSIGGALKLKELLLYSDLIFLFSMSLFILSLFYKKVKSIWLYIFFGLSFIYFWIGGVPCERYVPDVIIIYFYIIAGGVVYLREKNTLAKEILFFTIVLFSLTNGLLHFYLYNRDVLKAEKQYAFVNSLVGNTPTGIIEKHPISAFIRKVGYMDRNANAIPISIYFPNLEPGTNITKDLLLADGKYFSLDSDSIYERLSDSGLSKFIYIVESSSFWLNKKTYFDPDQEILAVLNEYCGKKDLSFMAKKYIILFEDCVLTGELSKTQ